MSYEGRAHLRWNAVVFPLIILCGLALLAFMTVNSVLDTGGGLGATLLLMLPQPVRVVLAVLLSLIVLGGFLLFWIASSSKRVLVRLDAEGLTVFPIIGRAAPTHLSWHDAKLFARRKDAHVIIYGGGKTLHIPLMLLGDPTEFWKAFERFKPAHVQPTDFPKPLPL